MPTRSWTGQLWASFRLAVVSLLLAAPPPRGQLEAEIRKLAERDWPHPITHEPRRYAFSTIEQWYYRACAKGANPIEVLGRKVRADSGRFKSIDCELAQAIRDLHRDYRDWSHQLHHENLVALAEKRSELGRVPSYSTVLRFRTAHGLLRERLPGNANLKGVQRALERRETREVRGFEADYVHELWHCDGHHCSRKVLRATGVWEVPVLIAVMDDHSRLVCHAQWYWGETAENVVHALMQAFQKRGLCRRFMTDNGGGLNADEVNQGLERLSITHETTLAYSPYQNGKQEHLWLAVIEERLMAMLARVTELTLALLNSATQAVIELDYHQKIHSETQQTPLARFTAGPDVGRPCPAGDVLRQVFGAQESRTVRRTDGTVSIDKKRYEIPSRFRHLKKVTVRYASWDLANVNLVDERTNKIICRILPRDLSANADGRRRVVGPVVQPDADVSPPTREGLAPLLEKLLADYAATGLPPAYIPKDDQEGDK